MASFKKTLNGDSRYKVELTVNEITPPTSTDIANNSTRVTYSLNLTRNYSTGGYYTSSKTNPIKITINGEVLVNKKIDYDFRGETSIPVASGTATILHEADGTKTIQCSGYFKDASNSLGSATASGSLKLTDIPRASVPRLSSDNIDMGTEITIYIDRVVNTYTHTLKYTFKNITETIATNVEEITTWTPPVSLAYQIPNLQSDTGLIICETYSDNELIGTIYKPIRLNVPSYAVPTVLFASINEVGDVPSNWNVFVKTKSKIQAYIYGTGSFGSTISSYKISYYGGELLSNTITTDYITNSGNIDFTGQTTDTRGRIGTTTETVNIVDYSSPTISVFEVQRCDIDGNIDKNGDYCYVAYTGSISPCLGRNTLNAEYKFGYKINGTESYTYVSLANNVDTYSEVGMLYTDGIYPADRQGGTKLQLPATNTYDIEFYIKDYFAEIKNNQILDTGFDLLNFNPSGKSIAIGKVSEASPNEEKLEVALETIFYEDIEAENINANDVNCNSVDATSGDFDTLTIQNQPVLMPYVLYDDVETSGNITLSDSSANYEYTDTYYTWEDTNIHTCSRTYSPNGKTIELQMQYDNGTYLYNEVAFYGCNGTALNRTSASRWRFATSGNPTRTNTTSSNNPSIRIYRVVGYK